MVCAVLSMGVLGAAWRGLIEPRRVDLAAQRARLVVVQAGVQQAAAIAQRLPAVRQEVASLEVALLQSTAGLSDEQDAQGVLRGLHAVASESRLDINSFTPKPGVEREQYVEWPIEVGLEGGYHDLARFFDTLASDQRLISVSDLQFKVNTTAQGPRRGLVQATCVAAMFIFAGAVVGADASPFQQPPPGPLKIGARVGVLPKGGYDVGGRRDPFASVIAEKAATPVTSAESVETRPRGLAGVAIEDVTVRGIIGRGQKWLAIVAGPDGAMYLAHSNDRLRDGMVQRIDGDAVVFLSRVPRGPGGIGSREVRKALRPGAGAGR